MNAGVIVADILEKLYIGCYNWFDDSNQSFNDNVFFRTIDDYLIACLNLDVNPESFLQNKDREFRLSSDILF